MNIGIDVGGTKTEVIALAPDGEELCRRRLPTPGRSHPELVACLQSLIEHVESATGSTGPVGIGLPGITGPDGLVLQSSLPCLPGRNLRTMVEAGCGRPVRLANDANCFVLSEARDGAGRGADVVFGIILGTGCGGGLVVRGELVGSSRSLAGEWGHNPLPWRTVDDVCRPCYCGKTSCNESFLSGPALEGRYAFRTGQHLPAAAISARAEAGDVAAGEVLDAWCLCLAKALSTVINLIDPAVIVVGGGLSRIPWLYRRVPAYLPDYVFGGSCRARLVPAMHGDSSGVRGAAWLWGGADLTPAFHTGN